MTLKRAEGTGKPPASPDAMARLQQAFEDAGVIFVAENGEGAGVRLRKQARSDAGFRPTGPATDVVEMMDEAIKEHETKRKSK